METMTQVILLIVSTFNTSALCENLYFSNEKEFFAQKCNLEITEQSIYQTKRNYEK